MLSTQVGVGLYLMMKYGVDFEVFSRQGVDYDARGRCALPVC
jgi:hypothetical protein